MCPQSQSSSAGHPLPAISGGKLVVQYQKKPTKHPKCAATGVRLHGVSAPWAAVDF
jgi:ribosomal protein L34E